MAEKKSWRDYTQTASTAKATSNEKTGSWRDYTSGETTSTTSGNTRGSWRGYSNINDVVNTAGKNVVDRVNNWLTQHNNYISNYKNRYSDRKYNYEDAYVSDSAGWVNTVTRWKSNLDAEADEVLSYLDQFEGYLDKEWVNNVKKTISDARSSQGLILDSSKQDHEYWTKFMPNEEQTAAGYTADKVYQEWQTGQKQYANDKVYDVEAGALELEQLKKDREAYLAEKEEKRKQAQSEESFWDSLGRWLGTTPDTSLPLGGVNSTTVTNSGSTTKYDKQIAELEEQINRAKYVQGYEGFMGNITADDFGANSQYVSTRTETPMEDAIWGIGTSQQYDQSKLFGDFLYDYINKNQDALDVATVNNTASSAYFMGLDKGFLQTMTDDEIKVYNYLYNTQGQESANEFLSFIGSDLKGRKRQQEQAFWAAYAKESPVASSVFSTLISPLKGLSYLGQAADMLDDGKMEENAGYNRFSDIPSTIRSQVSTTIENSGKWGKVGSFAYNTGMSMADFLYSTAISGGNQALSLSIMGTGAAADATIAAKKRGLDDSQAFTLGTIAGLAEVAMEKISLGAWLEGDMTEGALKYMLKNALSEGGEEASTSIINLLADVIVAGDKSEWNVAMQAYIDEGKTPEEAFGLVFAEQAAQIGLDALGGILSGAAIGGGTYAGTSAVAGVQYGDIGKNKAEAQNLVTEGLQLAPDNQYIQKMQGKVEKGKNLTGMQVRNILAANQEQITSNDMKLIQQAAEKRLSSLGQTQNVSKVAELATKWATGQELTRSEKRLLTTSQYGSRVANELLPTNIDYGKYSTEWAEEIGTREVNATSYNKKTIRTLLDAMASAENPATYKSLEERVGEESSYKVSKSGQATIRETGEAISLEKAEVVNIGKGDISLKVDGKEVKASEIDFADESQSYLIEAVSNIENITPGAATAIIRDYDPSSEQTVGEYLNGIDEAYTYGYHGYSVEDMQAGNFTPKLTSEQMMSAYRLGQSAKNIGIEAQEATYKRMRTAAEVAVAKNETTTNQKAQFDSDDVDVYFEDGGTVVKFDEHNAGQYDEKRMAGVNAAKFLSKMGIGGKYYFYESYENADGVRVYKDARGNEVTAPNGIYKSSDGSIHIDMNAGQGGDGTTLFTLGHEATHFVKQHSKKQFKALSDLVTEAYSKSDTSMHDRVLEKQSQLEKIRGEKVSYDEAFEEVVADAMSTMFSDGNIYEKLAELKTKDKGLFDTIKQFFEKLIAKFKKLYEELTPDQKDAQDIRAMKDMFDRIQTAFAEALVEASDNFRASEQVLAEAGIEVNAKTDSGSLLSVRDVLNEKDRKNVAKALADRFNVTVEEAMDWLKAETSLASIILNPKYSAFLDYEADPNEVAIKQNSDYPQGTVDFSNICKKRREFTQVMNRILRNFPNHVFAATDLAKIRTIMGEEGMTLPCGICYVEDRRQLDSIVAQDFIDSLKLYREGSKTRPDGKPFNANQLKGLQLTDGDTYVPNIYELVTLEGRNSLKEKNPNMEAAWVKYNNARGMQAVRLLTNEAEYKRQILKYSPKTVQTKNDYGGLRIYSFSDAEMFHLIDIIQVLTDCAAVGLKVQGYTKVNEYAKAVKDTGEKLNRSLIPLGDLGYHMENGKVVLDYDPVEGIDINSKDFFDSTDNPDVGNIVIGINPTQIRAAMVSNFIDYIIPFHTGQSAEVLGEKGIAAWVNYKDSQSEVDLATGKKSAHQINIYTEVFQAAEDEGKPIRNKRDFVNKFLAVCKENGLKPRFAEFLNMDANGDYVYTEGYHKLLVDFKTFAQTEVGEYLPQMPVKPVFEDAYITGLLKDYVTEQKAKDAEVAEQMPKVIKRITDEIVKPTEGGVKKSDRITLSMTDEERTAIIRQKSLIAGVYEGQAEGAIKRNKADLDSGKIGLVKSALVRIGDEFGIFTDYDIADVDVKIQLAKSNIKESVSKDISPVQIAKLLPVLKTAVENAIGIESHANRYFYDDSTVYFENLLGGYVDGEYFVPVRFGLKHSTTGEATLYVIVDQQPVESKKIKAEVVKIPGTQSVSPAISRSAFKVSIANLARFVNGKDLLRYLPDNILSAEQKKTKWEAIAETVKKTNDKNDAKYTAFLASGNLRAAQNMVNQAARVAGYTASGYHGSRTPGFTVVDKYSWLWLARGKAVASGYGTHNTVDSKGKPYDEHGVYAMRYNLGNNIKVYADGASWGELPVTEDEYPGVYADEETGYITTNAMAEWAERNGYDSITFEDVDDGGLTTVDVVFNPNRDVKSADLITYDDNGKVIPLSERFNTENDDIRYSERTGDSVSNRSLLANAFEGITQNSNEYKLIQEYKGRIKLLNEQEEKLAKLNAEIRKIRFGTEGVRDTARLTQLEAEAKNTAQAINRQDKKLLSLEASEPLRKVIERERKKEAQKTKDHVKEIQQNKKVRAEQTELRHKIRKTIRDLDKILNRGNKKLNVKEDLQPVVTKALQAAEILFTDNYGSYDMLRNGIGTDMSDAEEALFKTCAQMLSNIDKMTADSYEGVLARQEAESRLRIKMSKLSEVFARERKRLNNTTVSSILGELADAYAKLNDSTMAYVQGAYSEPVYNFLKNLQSEVGGTIVRDMTKNQLEHTYAAYRMVLETVRNANKMFNAELKQSREQLGNAVIEEVINAGGVHLLGTKLGDTISQFDWNNLKPVWVGDRIGSETFGKLMNGLFKGQYNFAEDIDAVRRFKLEMDEKYKPRIWDAEKLYEFESSTGKKFSLNLQQIMSLYAFSKREQAYSHLLNGGFVFEENSTVIVEKNGIKRTYIHKGAASYKVNEATLNGIVNSLTAEQKAYVDDMQAYLSNVMGAKGNEVSMKLYGIEMFKEKFYFPLRSSGAYMEKAKEAEMKKQQGQINLVNSGFTHAVKPEAKNPIVLSGFMDVWAEHCNEMSMYHSMVLPMEDFRKVYNYTTVHDENMESASVYQTIQDAYGKAATSYIDQLYRELNAGATVDPRETPWKKLISNFKKSSVMLSASVWVQQFSSIGRAYAVIDPKHFIGAKVNSDTKLSAAEEMKKYAPVAIIKEMGGFDTGTKGNAKAYIMAEQYGKGERIQGLLKDEQYRGDLMGYLPAKADEKTWAAIWEAAKRETKANNPKMDVKSEAFLKLAGERFSEVIEKTQVYDSVLARSANMRSKGNFMSMVTAFMAEPTTTVNLLENAIRSGNGKHIARAFGAVAVSIVLNNALASIVYAMRDDDEDETLLEKYFQSFTSGMIDDINPMSYYPFLKDVYSLFQGYDVERTDMSVIADVRDALKKAVSLLGKDTSDMDDEELAAHYKQVNAVLMGVLDAGCSAFGVPVKNVRRDVNGLINAFTTAQKDLTERDNSWLSFWDKVGSAVKDTIPIYAWTKDNAKTDKLYDAIVSGDQSYLARLKSTYKTDSAYQSAVRKALRENDSRIQEAAQAKYEGNTEAYKRIFNEIKKEGKFSFDDIMSAINTELSKLQPDKVTSDYTASGYVEAVAMGNTTEAKAMRDDIIATHMANGKTEDEAEEAFASAVATGIRDAYSSGLLDEARAEKMLQEYAGKDEEEAVSKVSYWAFCEEHPKYKDILTEANVAKYHEFAEPENISVDVYAQFIAGTNGLADIKDEWGDVEVTKREQVLEVIDSLPLTWQQKDALYLAYGYKESTIWDVPW